MHWQAQPLPVAASCQKPPMIVGSPAQRFDCAIVRSRCACSVNSNRTRPASVSQGGADPIFLFGAGQKWGVRTRRLCHFCDHMSNVTKQSAMRAIISRAICAAGLHPTIGLHHSNPGNAFALADDLMEPYRPLVDRAVVNLVEVGFKSVEPEPKRILAALSAVDLKTSRGNSPLYIHSTRLAQQLASIMTDEYTTLELPIPPDAEVLNQLGKLPAPGV